MTEQAGAARAVLIVEVGGGEFGLPVDQVREVVRVPPLTRLPFPPPTVLGVTSVRGEIVAVMDLGERLLGPERSSAGGDRLVVVEDPNTGSDVGLLVAAVSGLLSEPEAAEEAPAEVEAGLPPGWIDGIVAGPEHLVTVLRLDSVLDLEDAADKERS